MNDTGSGFRVSQGYDVLVPKSGRAYPIPCDEWDFLKRKLRQVSAPPWVYQNVASLLAGMAITTFTAILIGMLPSPSDHPHAAVIAWAIVCTSTICGALCIFFAIAQRRMQAVHVSDVITQMELIERRYEPFGGSVQGTASVSLKILSARYGAADKYADVTASVVQSLNHSGLRILVGNHLSPDPCPGIPKRLIVEYECGDKSQSKTAAEGDVLSIP